MEKFERLLELPRELEIKAHVDDIATIRCLNAHSEVIEALAETTALASEVATTHTSALETLGGRLLTVEGVLVKGYDPRNRGRVVNIAADSLPRMTADEAADIIVAVQDDVLANLNDSTIRGWTRGVVTLMVGALRDHGRGRE